MDISFSSGNPVLRNVDSSGALQSSVNQEQSPLSSLADYSVSDLVNAVDESLSIKGVGEESLNVKDVGKESTDIQDVNAVDESLSIKGVGEESLNVKDVGKESTDIQDVGEESSNVKDVGEVEHAFNGDNINGVEVLEKRKITRKCLNKCATSPNPYRVLPPNGSSDVVEENPETAMCMPFGEEHLHPAYSRSVSLPVPLKLLSALKGSREKEGLSPEKLSVTWAPDVYDPPATSTSHTVTGKKQQKSKNKKNWKKDGKKGQKGSSSRGKEKKQYRKGGASERCHRSLDTREPLDDFGELAVGSPDQHSYCGSSFVKNSLASMHYPVAEAL